MGFHVGVEAAARLDEGPEVDAREGGDDGGVVVREEGGRVGVQADGAAEDEGFLRDGD